MGKKYSDSIAIFTCVIIVVSLIIFLALSIKDSNSKDPDRERTPNATEVITAPEQLGAGPTKVINTSQGKPESDVSKVSKPSDSNETPVLKQYGAGPTKVINTSQVNSESDVSKLSESCDPNGTPAEIIIKEIEKNIRSEADRD